MNTKNIKINLDSKSSRYIEQITKEMNCTSDWLITKALNYYLDALKKGKIKTDSINRISDNDTNKTENYSTVFVNLAKDIITQSDLRKKITSNWRISETSIIPKLLEQTYYSENLTKNVLELARDLAYKLRNKKCNFNQKNIIQDLLQEFSLSSDEGIALMCLSEALLRIPDKETRNDLIRDKIVNQNWKIHLKNKSLFVNAAVWGLLITGYIVRKKNNNNLFSCITQLLRKRGEPIVRNILNKFMKLIGKQFVAGECINSALLNAKKLEKYGFRYSYDILGEAALTEDDAKSYLIAYEKAIHAIGLMSKNKGIYDGPGISIKLSALHPRYCRSQYKRVMNELYPRLKYLAVLSKKYDIGFNIDAEESYRLEISLDLLNKLCFEPELSEWNGIGFVIQAYQKRCIFVIDELIDLAKRSKKRLMIRLVKGAYWDSEIKNAQLEGMEDYPVFTRKVYTDLSYLACARKMLKAPKYIYPQFATHNSHTLSAIYYIAGKNYYPGQYEFQCLYGMGESLYKNLVNSYNNQLNRPCRIYAPVGSHKTLLAYLVRRLLENGANTSFVNRIADKNISIDRLIVDPIQEVKKISIREGKLGISNPKIPLPRDIYGMQRLNSSGLDLSNENNILHLSNTLVKFSSIKEYVKPILFNRNSNTFTKFIVNPANYKDIIGECCYANNDDVIHAVNVACDNAKLWYETSYIEKAKILNKASSLFEKNKIYFINLLVREAGKNFNNAISEIREAIDFLRYYANQISRGFDNKYCKSLGPVICISPWNFPLAIFIGQISSALAVGNTVLAKPAEQTPVIAYQATKIMLSAGIPEYALQLLIGKGEIIGSDLISDSRIRGVMFTGSTYVARTIQSSLSGRLNSDNKLIPFIAETGGLNAMIVDSSALTEQVVTDVLSSAFDSAGQRCSSLRILCLQEEIANKTIDMLKGAITEYNIGNPEYLSTDIGPIIDASAKNNIENHISNMRKIGCKIWQNDLHISNSFKYGSFVLPTLIELNNLDDLKEEIFGPVLHIIRYNKLKLDELINKINLKGYGLTLGIHSRIDETINYIISKVNVGNYYVNRNMIGAVVGVQPFGGEGLSGTGPKSGGPLYLYKLLLNRSDSMVLSSLKDLESISASDSINLSKDNISNFLNWIKDKYPKLLDVFNRSIKFKQNGIIRLLNGPTGERNSYYLIPHKHILCLADNEIDIITQLISVINIGSNIMWINNKLNKKIFDILPDFIKRKIIFTKDWQENTISSILFHGDSNQLINLSKIVSNKNGPLIIINNYNHGDSNIFLERLFKERVTSINTTASGGNVNLISIA